jgi:hypothetical protein
VSGQIRFYPSCSRVLYGIWPGVCKDLLKWHAGPSWPWPNVSWIYNYLCAQCLSSLMLWVRISIRAMCTTLCDKVCQWLTTGRWFFPVPRFPPPIKTDRHDITEILLKVASNAIKQTNNIIMIMTRNAVFDCHTVCFQFHY